MLALYFFGFALCLVLLTLVAGVLQASFRVGRRLVTLGRTQFSVSAREVRPGDTIEARAVVVPRASRAVTVDARLTCTMFDHRAHELYASSRTLRAGASNANEYVASLVVPPYALRTGKVGDKAHNPFSEHGRHMLVVWTVDFEVRSTKGTLLQRKSRAFDVPRGRRLKTHLRRMSLLAIDSFSSIRNDMLFNWLVHLAACDGEIRPPERRFMHQLLEEMGGMVDRDEADARVDRELQRRLVIDDVFLQRYVPLESRLEFYQALHTLAACDGPLHEKEVTFLADSLKSFGLSAEDVRHLEVEEEVAIEREPDDMS